MTPRNIPRSRSVGRDGTPRFFQPRGGARVFVPIPVVHRFAQQLEQLNVAFPESYNLRVFLRFGHRYQLPSAQICRYAFVFPTFPFELFGPSLDKGPDVFRHFKTPSSAGTFETTVQSHPKGNANRISFLSVKDELSCRRAGLNFSVSDLDEIFSTEKFSRVQSVFTSDAQSWRELRANRSRSWESSPGWVTIQTKKG